MKQVNVISLSSPRQATLADRRLSRRSMLALAAGGLLAIVTRGSGRSLAAPYHASEYAWNHDRLSPLALADAIPLSSLPSPAWLLQVADRLLRAGLNVSLADSGAAISPHKREAADRARHTLAAGGHSDAYRLIEAGIAGIASAHQQSRGRAPDLRDYDRLFSVIDLPPIARSFDRDTSFARLQTAGPNPLVLKSLDRFDGTFPLTDEEYRQVMRGDSLASATAAGRLYVSDYAVLTSLETDPNVTPRKFPYAPIALFAEHPQSGRLMPIAIRLQQTPTMQPTYFADGSNDWLMAKTILSMANATHHEAVSHLARTHLFMEPFAVATGRNLPEQHPVRTLLWPHFEGTLFINRAAVDLLLAPDGPVDHLLNGTLDSVLRLASQAVLSYSFNDNFLPRAIVVRGTEGLTDYPYRDDAMLYWDTIRSWVSDYLALAYPGGDADVGADLALKAWYYDLVSHDGGRITGFGEGGTGIHTLSYLTDALTMIIFTASVQHAAVNFPQYDVMSYAPAMPLAAYAAVPKPGSRVSNRSNYLELLPPLERALEQLSLGYLLGTVHHTRLGEYPWGQFGAPMAWGPLAAFQRRLSSVGRTIRRRNASRRSYEVLLPEGIPQSINI